MLVSIPWLQSALNFPINGILIVKSVPKHLNFSTISKDLLPTFMLWFCPACWSQDMTVHLVFSELTPDHLLTSNCYGSVQGWGEEKENESAAIWFKYYMNREAITKLRKSANVCGQFIRKSINDSLRIIPVYFGWYIQSWLAYYANDRLLHNTHYIQLEQQ